jgi:hypothetical protein
MKPIYLKTFNYEQAGAISMAQGGVCFIPIKDTRDKIYYINPNRISFFGPGSKDYTELRFGNGDYFLPINLSLEDFIKQLEAFGDKEGESDE